MFSYPASSSASSASMQYDLPSEHATISLVALFGSFFSTCAMNFSLGNFLRIFFPAAASYLFSAV